MRNVASTTTSSVPEALRSKFAMTVSAAAMNARENSALPMGVLAMTMLSVFFPAVSQLIGWGLLPMPVADLQTVHHVLSVAIDFQMTPVPALGI